MKKLRLSLKPESKEWSFILFDSPEAAYYMAGYETQPDDEFCLNVSLSGGDFMEVEWTGMEFVYDDPSSESMFIERIRLAKSYDTTLGDVTAFGYVETYTGWLPKGTIPWNRRSHKDVKITRLGGRNKSRLDFSRIFKDKSDDNTVKLKPEHLS